MVQAQCYMEMGISLRFNIGCNCYFSNVEGPPSPPTNGTSVPYIACLKVVIRASMISFIQSPRSCVCQRGYLSHLHVMFEGHNLVYEVVQCLGLSPHPHFTSFGIETLSSMGERRMLQLISSTMVCVCVCLGVPVSLVQWVESLPCLYGWMQS